ncbi:MAG: hypothetical protein HYX51_04860 [Chloroflexi bacterium]|nr:hypothetical protein [Chloroflexota bacterium]
MTLQSPIPVYIVVGRIVAVVGMSLAIALGIFILLAGRPGWGFAALVAAAPFAAMIFLIERAPGGASNEGAKSSGDTG